MKLSPRYKKSLSAISLVALPLLVAFAPLSQVVIAQESEANLSLVAQADRKAEADRLLDHANQLYLGNHYQEALQISEQALQIYREIKFQAGEGRAILHLGGTYESLGKYQKANEYYRQSLNIFKQIGDRKGEASSLRNLGSASENLGQYQEALKLYRSSLFMFKQIEDRKGEGYTLMGIGGIYFRLGQYQEAINYYQRSLVSFDQIGERNGKVYLLIGLGNTYRNIGQYKEAIEFYRQSIEIAKQIGDRNGEGYGLTSVGNIYSDLGQYKKAIEFYLQSLPILSQIRDRNGEAVVLSNLGSIHAENVSQYNKAIEYCQKSLVIRRQIGDRYGEPYSLVCLGSAYQGLKQYQQAIVYYQQSLIIRREIRDLNGEGNSLITLGDIYNYLNEYQKSIDYYQQGLNIKKKIKDRAGEGYTLNNLGLLLTKCRQFELAIIFYKNSVNIRESIRKDISGLKKEEQKSYLGTIEKDYRALANLLLKQGRVMEALQILDLIKVQELEDYLKNVKGSERSAQGVRILEPEKVISTQLKTISFENSADINRQLVSQLQQIPKSEINKVPDYLKQIPQGSVLIYPLILEDRLEIILFSPNTLPISRTVNISKAKLEELVIEFRNGLRDDGSEDYQQPAVALYNSLIKPIETELIQAKATTILYAPDGILRYVPLAAFYDGKQYLIEKYQVSNLIAYSLSDFSPRQKSQPNILAGAFGGKAGELKFGQQGLPATIREVQAIANSFQNSVTLTEEKFSRKAIESKFKNHNILHLATHAEFNVGAPDNSFIIFGNGDKIRLNEITDWQIPNIDLIVLSACQTGVGKLGSGVEILGFGYQVQKIGVKNAIASLWSVDDAGTQALMEAFYKELKKGDVTTTEALHRAQVTLIKSDKFKHPNYWSAFFAIGNGL